MRKNMVQRSQHVYPRSAMLADVSSGLLGLLVCGFVGMFAQPVFWLSTILAVVAVLFAYYVLGVLQRRRCLIEMDADGLSIYSHPGHEVAQQRLAWSELERLELNYFSTRRDARNGWFELRLRCGAQALSIDSRLLGFEDVLACALDAAGRAGIALTASTAANLASFGFSDDGYSGKDGRHNNMPGPQN